MTREERRKVIRRVVILRRRRGPLPTWNSVARQMGVIPMGSGGVSVTLQGSAVYNNA